VLVALLLAAWALKSQFAAASLSAMQHAWQAQSTGNVACAVAFTAVSFGCLGLYDRAAAHVVAPRVSGTWAWMTGVLANAVSNTLGFHAVTGTLVRARLYGRCGLDKGDVARIVSLSWLALGLGFVAMLAAAQLLNGLKTPHDWGSLAIGLSLSSGVGVFEVSVTALLSGAGRADLLAALLLYRAIYNLVPFLLSLALLAALGGPQRTQFDGG